MKTKTEAMMRRVIDLCLANPGYKTMVVRSDPDTAPVKYEFNNGSSVEVRYAGSIPNNSKMYLQSPPHDPPPSR